jgi:hypothetical protein
VDFAALGELESPRRIRTMVALHLKMSAHILEPKQRFLQLVPLNFQFHMLQRRLWTVVRPFPVTNDKVLRLRFSHLGVILPSGLVRAAFHPTLFACTTTPFDVD